MHYFARLPIGAGFSPLHTNSKLPNDLSVVNSSSRAVPKISLEGRMFSLTKPDADSQIYSVQVRKRSVGHSSLLSSSDKSGNEGRKPRMPCGVWGRIDIIAAFPGPGRTLCLGIFFLRKSQSSQHINTRQH